MANRQRLPVPQMVETTCVSRAKQVFAAAIKIPDVELVRMVVDESGFEAIAIDRLVEKMVYEISMLVSTYPIQTITQERTVSWPDGWWQALRERVLPRKWLNKHPVLRQRAKLTCRLDLSSIYKQLEGAVKDERPIVLYDADFTCHQLPG